MAAKYPEGTPRPRFDKDVWTTASGGVKKGYVKGIGLKRSRPSSFTATSATSSVNRSTATSAAPTSQQSTHELAMAICSDPALLDALGAAVLTRMTPEQIQAHLNQRAHSGSSQASANAEVIHFKCFELYFSRLFLNLILLLFELQETPRLDEDQ